MTEIKIGDIFQDDEHYSERAQWCNENGCYIEEIEKDEEGNRQFQIKEVVIPEPTPEEQIQAITNAVQIHLDKAVQALNYDNGFACASYATSSNPKFRAEAQSYVKWRDEVWARCYALLDDYQAGKIEMPTVNEVIAMLPEFVVESSES